MVESGSYHTFIFQIFLLHDRCKYVYCRYLFIMICTYSFLYQTYSEFLANSFPIYNLSTSIQNQKNNSQKSTRNKIQALCVYDCSFDIYILLQAPIFWCCLQGDWPTPTSYLSTSNGNPQKQIHSPPKKMISKISPHPFTIHYAISFVIPAFAWILDMWVIPSKHAIKKPLAFAERSNKDISLGLACNDFLRLWETGVRWLLSSVGMLFLSRCLCNFG